MPNDITIHPGKITKILSMGESKAVIQEWLNIYGKNRTGCRIKDFKWHLFSNRRYEASEGLEALKFYAEQIASEYLVIDNDEIHVFVTDQKPERVGLSDYYVCPPNMAWTMAFTHEDGWLGPYFAKHPEYTKLDLKNKKHRHKLEQIEHAKKNGWC